MNFSLKNVAKSLADYLSPSFPGLTFYEDPAQQALDCPCAFLQLRSSNTQRRIRGWQYRDILLDLTYLEDYNLPDLQQRYQAAAEILDDVMASFPYSDESGTILMLTYERQWRIDLDALHYNFSIHVQQEPDEPFNPMQTLQVNEVAKDEEV